MHAVSHSLSHRGPNATRARARWQPYSAVTLSSSNASTSRTPSVAYLHTPASSVSSSPPNVSLNPACDSVALKAHPLPPSTPGLARDPSKTKYAIRLVDQAVRSLCDTWHPDDIPPVFSSPSCSSSVEPVVTQRDGRTCAINPSLFSGRNIQLPSPISPSTQSSLSPFLPDPSESFGRPSGCANLNRQLLPIKGFVHEVLRRSRTSVGVLQTALCYLEAVRTKVPALIEKAKANGTSTEPEYAEPDAQNIQGQPMACDDLLHEAETLAGATAVSSSDSSETDTVRVSDGAISVPVTPASLYEHDNSQGSIHPPSSPKPQQSAPLPPLPPLPSPLLCPRRTFLACLILASKFMQDRSYSNRAWAKLAGLHPREIGRCERAVGNVLEWRLWVGKDLPATTSTRSVTRSKSDGDLMRNLLLSSATDCTATTNTPSCASGDGYSYMDAFVTPVSTPIPTPRNSTSSGLRRYATVPDIQAGIANGPLYTNTFASPGPLAASAVYEGSATPLTSNMVSDIGPMETNEGELDVSPTSMSTPTMLCSPTSTPSTSSDGVDDGTVQMTFSDLPPPFPASYTPLSMMGSGNPADFDLNLYIKSVMSIPDSTFDTEIRLAVFNPIASGCALYNLPSLSEALQLGTF